MFLVQFLLLAPPFLIANAGAVVDNTPPAWPPGSTITAITITTSSIYISWTAATDNTGIVNYKVYVNGGWDGKYHMATSFGVQGLSANTTLTFLIVAIDNFSNWSDGPSRTFTTSPLQCAGYAACLVSKSMNDPRSSQGGTFNVNDTVTNEGQLAIRVTGMIVSGDIGTYSLMTDTGFLLSIGDMTSRALTIPVPPTESVGTHSLDFTISWQYNSTSGWTQGKQFVQNTSFSVIKASQPSPPGSNGGPLAGVVGTVMAYAIPLAITYLGLVALSVGLIIQRSRRKKYPLGWFLLSADDR